MATGKELKDFGFSIFDFRLGEGKSKIPTLYILCPLLVIFLLCSSVCATSESFTLSVGHLPPSHAGRTLLLITDLSGLGPAADISFYDNLGREVSTAHKLLPPNGKIQIDVESYLQGVGNIVLESSNQLIVGEYWQIHESGTVFMLPLQAPGEERRYFVNCFRFPLCSSNLLVISDPRGSGPEVQMEFYNRTGELIKIARKLLRPHGTLAFDVDEYAPWDVLGKVSVRSFRGSIVLHYRQSCNSEAVLAAPARLPAKELVIDRFSTGGEIMSNVVITDASAEGPVARIQFLSDRGAELVKKLLPPNGTVLIEPADYVGNVDNGIIHITSGSGVIADYWEKNPQTALYAPAIDKTGSDLFISYFSPFDNTQYLLSLLNTGKKPLKVRVQLYSNDGKELGNKEVYLEPYSRVDELVDFYFDEARLGTVIVRGTSASLIVTSHISDVKNCRPIGRAQAQIITVK